MQHESAWIEASVSVRDELDFGDVAPALQTLLRERVAPVALPSYGQHLASNHAVGLSELVSRYELRIEAAFATLHAAARHFPVYGLGPQVQVLDFGNMAGSLLEDDLATLEREAAPVTIWKRPRGTALVDALKQFTESELNLLIAEQLGAGQTDSKQAVDAVEKHFNSMVDARYIQRATVALRQGIQRWHGSSLLRPALLLIAGVAVVETLVYSYGPIDWRFGMSMLCALGAGVVGWIALEILTLMGILRNFPKQIGSRLHAQIKAGGGLTKWRVVVAASMLVTAFFTAKLLANNPGIYMFLRHGPPVEVKV